MGSGNIDFLPPRVYFFSFSLILVIREFRDSTKRKAEVAVCGQCWFEWMKVRGEEGK